MNLYKYYPLNDFSERVITHQEIFFSNWDQLNDPFEEIVKPNFNIPFAEKKKYWQNHSQDLKSYSEKDLKHWIEQVEKSYDGPWIGQIQSHIKRTNQNLGFYCMTSDPTNILMWSHYADRHQGFCLEIDCNYDPILKNHVKVKYNNKISTFNFYEGFNPKEIFAHKYTDWKYEKEFRAFNNKGTYIIPKECIKTVIVGCNYNYGLARKISEKNRKCILALADQHLNNTVKFKILRRNKHGYALVDHK